MFGFIWHLLEKFTNLLKKLFRLKLTYLDMYESNQVKQAYLDLLKVERVAQDLNSAMSENNSSEISATQYHELAVLALKAKSIFPSEANITKTIQILKKVGFYLKMTAYLKS